MNDETLALEWEVFQTIILPRAEKLGPLYPQAIWAAAVVHWFDADLLAAMLDEPPEGERQRAEADSLLAWLAERPFIERYYAPFAAPDVPLYAMHERSRSALLAQLKQDPPLPRTEPMCSGLPPAQVAGGGCGTANEDGRTTNDGRRTTTNDRRTATGALFRDAVSRAGGGGSQGF